MADQNKNNNRNIFMAMLGAYLAYQGFTLLNDAIKYQPENKVLFIVIGAVFLLAGAGVIIYYAKCYIAGAKEDLQKMPDETEEEEESSDVEGE